MCSLAYRFSFVHRCPLHSLLPFLPTFVSPSLPPPPIFLSPSLLPFLLPPFSLLPPSSLLLLLPLQHHLKCFWCFFSPSCGHRHCIQSRCSVGGDAGWTPHSLQSNLNRRGLSSPETLLPLLHCLSRYSAAAHHVWPCRGGGGWGHSRHIRCMDQLCSRGPMTCRDEDQQLCTFLDYHLTTIY